MLCVGHTDRCIARALQLSERTIRDHINRLSTVAQTRGRFALGAEAAWRGWLGRNDVERRT